MERPTNTWCQQAQNALTFSREFKAPAQFPAFFIRVKLGKIKSYHANKRFDNKEWKLAFSLLRVTLQRKAFCTFR